MARAKRYNWKQLKKVLEAHGWETARGGKHVTKMVKDGFRPVTLPHHKGKTYDIRLSQNILKQAGVEND